jgi:hypothetical protein
MSGNHIFPVVWRLDTVRSNFLPLPNSLLGVELNKNGVEDAIAGKKNKFE